MKGGDQTYWVPLIDYLETKPRNLSVDLAQRLMTLALQTENIPVIWKVLNLVRERGIELGSDLYIELILFFSGLDCWEDVLASVDQMHTNSVNFSKVRLIRSSRLPDEASLIAHSCRYPESFLFTGSKILIDWIDTLQPTALSFVPGMPEVYSPRFPFFIASADNVQNKTK